MSLCIVSLYDDLFDVDISLLANLMLLVSPHFERQRFMISITRFSSPSRLQGIQLLVALLDSDVHPQKILDW